MGKKVRGEDRVVINHVLWLNRLLEVSPAAGAGGGSSKVGSHTVLLLFSNTKDHIGLCSMERKTERRRDLVLGGVTTDGAT